MKFIFKVKIKDGHTEKEYIEAWKKGSAIIQKLPGARGTILHRKIDEPGVFIAIANWDSKELRDQAMKSLRRAAPEIQAVWMKHEEFGDIERIGNFEEIERVKPFLDNK